MLNIVLHARMHVRDFKNLTSLWINDFETRGFLYSPKSLLHPMDVDLFLKLSIIYILFLDLFSSARFVLYFKYSHFSHTS